MLCRLTRWMISRELDMGKKMPRFAARHAGRCDACRAYARFTASLPSRFSGEIPAVLAEAPDSLAGRIPPISDEAGPRRRSRFRRRLFLSPVRVILKAGAVVIILAVGVFLFRLVPGKPGPTAAATKAAFADLKFVTAVPDELQSAVAKAESSLVRERLLLEKSFLSVYDYLQARLNIRIERKGQRVA